MGYLPIWSLVCADTGSVYSKKFGQFTEARDAIPDFVIDIEDKLGRPKSEVLHIHVMRKGQIYFNYKAKFA